jgi:hypothetical protein
MEQTVRERGRLRRHLQELEDLREQRLRDLGGLALQMYRRDSFEAKLLWEKAGEVAAVEEERKRVQRGLEEGLTLDQLERMGPA